MKKKLASENRCNFFNTNPLELCFGELKGDVCPDVWSYLAFKKSPNVSRTSYLRERGTILHCRNLQTLAIGVLKKFTSVAKMCILCNSEMFKASMP